MKNLLEIENTLIFIFLGMVSEFLISKVFLGGSGCSTEGCKAAASLLSIPSIWVEYLGLAFGLSLATLFTLKKYSLFQFILFAGAIFETTIFFYQVSLGILCPYCLLVISTIYLILFVELLRTKNYKIALPILVIPFAFYILNTGAQKEGSFEIKDHYTLISSKECPHCKKVKEELFNKFIEYKNIDISETPEAISFLKNFGFKGIPILVIKESKDSFEIIYGEENIIEYFEKTSMPKFEEPSYYDIEKETGGCQLVNPKCD